VRKRIKQIFFSGSLEKQSLTLFPVVRDYIFNMLSMGEIEIHCTLLIGWCHVYNLLQGMDFKQ
jgi:hypothetical protein